MKNKKWFLVILILLLFIVNTYLMLNGYYEKVDDAVHSFIVRPTSNIMDKIMHIITFFGSTKFMVILCLLLFIIFLIKINNKYAMSTAGILIISTIINNVIKNIIRRQRPIYMRVVENSFCYPSGHMMASTTLYGFIIYMILKSNLSKSKKTIFTSLFTILIILIGISRIYLGAHFFSDIIGAALASMTLIIIYSIINDKYNLLKK